jgi:hypothetical protein
MIRSIKSYKWPIIPVVLLIAGCARTGVKMADEIEISGLPRPEQVLVYNFAVNSADVQQNSSIIARSEFL